MTRPRRALARLPGDSFARALSHHAERDTIDPGRARGQHTAYRGVLERLGLDVIVMPTDEELPDSCFVQDLAVVWLGWKTLSGSCRPSVAAALRLRVVEGRGEPPA